MSNLQEQLHISDRWREVLAAAGLDSFDALMHSKAGQCFSMHDRSQVYRIELPDGQTVFLKRDCFTSAKQILVDLLYFRRPQPLCEKERRGLLRASKLGLRVAEPLAWGQRRRCGLPSRGVLVMTAVPGKPLQEYLSASPPPAPRIGALRAAGDAVGKLYRAGLSWPDLLPKHILVDTDGSVGLVDLERLCRARCPHRCLKRQVTRFLGELRALGLPDGQIRAFADGLHLGELA